MTIARRPIASIEQVDGLQGALTRSHLLHMAARTAKGNVIGTNGKPVICLRIDDGQDAFKASIFALFRDRNLPAGYATIAAGSGAGHVWWTSGTTWADVHSWRQRGIEIWSHGYDHRDPQVDGDAGHYEDIVTSKALLEAQGFVVQGYMPPGVTQETDIAPYAPDYFTTTVPGYTGYAGRLVMENYAFADGYSAPGHRYLPVFQRYGQTIGRVISDGSSAGLSIAYINDAVARGASIELMTHPHNVGQTGKTSLADFTAVLDHVKALWDADTVEVLTPSGMYCADPNVTTRYQMLLNSDFEGLTPSGTNLGAWTNLDGTDRTYVTTGGGHSGDSFVRMSSTSVGNLIQRPVLASGQYGESYIFEGWARSNGGDATTTTSRVIVQDYTSTARLSIVADTTGIGTDWVRIRIPFCTHPLTTTLTIAIGLGPSSSSGVDWDDVRVWKI